MSKKKQHVFEPDYFELCPPSPDDGDYKFWFFFGDNDEATVKLSVKDTLDLYKRLGRIITYACELQPFVAGQIHELQKIASEGDK